MNEGSAGACANSSDSSGSRGEAAADAPLACQSHPSEALADTTLGIAQAAAAPADVPAAAVSEGHDAAAASAVSALASQERFVTPAPASSFSPSAAPFQCFPTSFTSSPLSATSNPFDVSTASSAAASVASNSNAFGGASMFRWNPSAASGCLFAPASSFSPSAYHVHHKHPLA
jgi:hypothetical protein